MEQNNTPHTCPGRLFATQSVDGTHPLTDTVDRLQIIQLKYPRGRKWDKHTHTDGYPEAIVLVSGRLSVTACERDGSHETTYIMEPGQCFYNGNGGFSAEALEDVEFFEFKPGPFDGNAKILI